MGANLLDKLNWSTPNDKSVSTDNDFISVMGKSDAYKSANTEGKASIRLAYQQLVEEQNLKNPNGSVAVQAREDQNRTDRQGFTANVVDKTIRSHKQGAALLSLINDSLNPDGTLDDSFYEHGAAYLQKQRTAPKTYEEKKLDADVTGRIKAFKNGDATTKFKAAMGLIGDVVTNPKALVYLGADSSSSISAMLGGGKAGALAGTGVAATAAAVTGGLAAPIAAVTVPVGTAAGTIAASTAHSGSQKFMDLLDKALTERNIAATPANMKAFVESNPEIIKGLQKKSGVYGLTMGTTDTILGGIGGRVATMPERAALRQAATAVEAPVVKAALTAATKESGKSLEEITKNAINIGAREILEAQTFKSKLGYKAAGTAVEIASEPTTEAAATLAAGEKVTAKDLIMETLGGIGAGPYGAAVNTSLFGTKVAADKTKEFTNRIIASTPESRAAVKEQKAEIKAAKIQQQAPTDYAFKKDVANTDINDPKVSEWADPTHATYNPIKAVTILAKSEDPDTDVVDRAQKVKTDFYDSILALSDQKDALVPEYNELVKNNDNRAIHLKEKMDNMQKTIDEKVKTFKQVSAQVRVINERAQISAQTKEVKSIDPVTATPEEVTDHITSSLGSHGNANSVTNEGIATLLKRTDITDDQRTMLGALTEANIARANINSRVTSGKTMSDVSNDIYHGIDRSDFKGIDAYRQGIMQYLTGGRTEEALKQLEGLKKFRDSHQSKSDQVTDIFDTLTSKDGKLTPAQEATYAALVKNKTVKYINSNSGNLVTSIQNEAAALNAEVKLAESLIAVHQNKGKATTSPTSAKPVTAPLAAPVSEPGAVAKTGQDRLAVLANDLRSGNTSLEGLQEIRDLYRTANKNKNEVEHAANILKFGKQYKEHYDANSQGGIPNEDSIQEMRGTETQEVVESVADKTAPITEEINPSTTEEITDSFSNTVNSLDELEVTFTDTDGNEVTKTYAEAIQDIDAEINEAEAILKCFRSK